MKYTILGKSDLKVSSICMGCMGFGNPVAGQHSWTVSEEETRRIIGRGLEKGINFFDTAQYYQTYPYIKEALKGTNYNAVISSKSLAENYHEMMEAIEEARKSLDRDVIDIFLMHEVRPYQLELRKGAWQALKDAKKEGLVRAIGLSTHHSPLLSP